MASAASNVPENVSIPDERMSDFRRSCCEGNYEEFETQIDRLDDVDVTLSQRDGRGVLVIHDAARGGNVRIISELLRRGCSPIEETAREKDTPLHIATANGHQEAVAVLLERLQAGLRPIPTLKNRDGNTPLHLACEKGHTALVQILNKRFPGHSIVANKAHRTPIQVAASKSKTEIVEIFLKFGKGNPAQFNFTFQGLDEKQSLDTPLNVFVVGERRCGKSTLITTLQQEKKAQRFWGIAYDTLEVPDHGTGVVPTEYRSRFYGRVVFQDFASGSDYIHENLIVTEEALSNSIFILVLDSRPDRKDMEEKLEYWLNIIAAQCKKVSSPSNRPNLIVVSSFIDVPRAFRLAPAHRLSKVVSAVRNSAQGLIDNFNLIDTFWLDCRRAFSPQLDALQKSLKHVAKSLQLNNEPIPCFCYFLSSLLKNLESSSDGAIPTLKLQDLSQIIQLQDASDPNASQSSSGSAISLFELLPHDPTELLPLCQILNDRKRILLLKENPGDPDNKTWIIHGLNKVMGLIENAFRDIKSERQQNLQMYIVDDNTIYDILSRTIPLPKKILIALVEHFKLHDRTTRELSNLSPEEFFIPSLLPKESSLVEWGCDSQGFGWTTVPIEAQECHFFLPRLQKLLLNHLFEFCTKYNFIVEKNSLWKEGFFLQNDNEMGVCVIVNKRAITLNMQLGAEQSHKLAVVELRNAIIREIRSFQKRVQPELKTEEFLIPKTMDIVFPVQNPRTLRMQFRLEDVRTAIRNRDTDIQEQPIQSMVLFEPCIHLRKIDRKLFGDPSAEVSPRFLEKFMESFGREDASAFAQHLSIDIDNLTLPAEIKSYRNFHSCLDSFSIFEDTANFLDQEESDSSTPDKTQEQISHKEPPQEELSPPVVSIFIEEDRSGDQYVDDEYVDHKEDGSSHVEDEVPTEKDSSLVRKVSLNEMFRDIPFEDKPESFECDSTGRKIESLIDHHGITIDIPPGAVPEGSPPVKVECGVTLPVSGPFQFPTGVKPISPVLWFCADSEEFEFSKPIEITLPHHINCSDSEEYKHLSFYKATHDISLKRQFSFEKITDGMKFEGNHGKLQTKHSCFLCICTNKLENIALRSNYCLINVTPKDFGKTACNAKLHFCVTYFVGTCIQTVREQYPENEFEIEPKKFSLQPGEANPEIQMQFDRNPPHKWVAGNMGGAESIRASEIDYTTVDAADLKMQEHNHVYPPRFTIKVTGATANESSMMPVSFTGAACSLKFEIVLPFVHPTVNPNPNLPPDTDGVAKIYTRHTVTFVTHINMTEIYPHLLEQGLLIFEEQRELLEGELRNNAQKLHFMLMQKGKKGMQRFIEALRKTTRGTGHGDIIEEFEKDPQYHELFR